MYGLSLITAFAFPYLTSSIPTVIPNVCQGLNTCRIYNLNKPTDTTTCAMIGTNIYNKSPMDPTTTNPFEGVSDNYVARYINEKDTITGTRSDSDSSDVGPRVKVKLTRYPYPATPRNLSEKAQEVGHSTYNWRYFMTVVKPTILSTLKYYAVGLYTLEIEAIDYFAISKCTYEAILIDPFTHVSPSACPTIANAKLEDLGIPNDLKQYHDWKTAPRDPYCKADNMDDLRLAPSSIATHTFTIGGATPAGTQTVDEGSCYNLTVNDLNALNSSAASLITQSCKTSCTLNGVLQRKKLDYDCPSKQWTVDLIPLTDDTCSYHGELVIGATDLFSTTLTPISSPTEFFMTTIAAGTITVNCNGKKPCFKKADKFKFSKFLKLTTVVNDAWTSALGSSSAPYTYTRYSIDGGVHWHTDLNDQIPIENTPATLTIEVYSGCGIVFQMGYTLQQSYNIPNHEVESKLCPLFEAYSLRTLDDEEINDHSEVCSYKGNTYSAFVPFSLSFDPNDFKDILIPGSGEHWERRGRLLSGFDGNTSQDDNDKVPEGEDEDHPEGSIYEINGIYCEAAINGDHSGISADDHPVGVHLTSDFGEFLPETHLKDDLGPIKLEKQFYALKLIHDRHTYPYTPLKTRCYISVKEHVDSPYTNAICDLEFYGKDCTPPNQVPNPSCSAYEEGACLDVSVVLEKKKISPGGICKGKYINAKVPPSCPKNAPCEIETEIHFQETAADVCCTDCGAATCESIPKTIGRGELKQCVFSNVPPPTPIPSPSNLFGLTVNEYKAIQLKCDNPLASLSMKFGWYGDPAKRNSCVGAEVTGKLQELCNGKNKCQLNEDGKSFNGYFGDPVKSIVKEVYILYTCVVPLQFTVTPAPLPAPFEDLKNCSQTLRDLAPAPVLSSMLRLPARVIANYGMFAFMTLGTVVSGVVVAIAMLGMHFSRQRWMVKNEESYSPLI